MIGKRRLWTVRNVLITALLLFLLWCSGGCPLPTLEMELHRMERQVLLTPAPVVWQYLYMNKTTGDVATVVSAGYGHVAARCSNDRGVILPLNREGATLFALPDYIRFVERGTSWELTFLAVNPPAGAERAVLALTVTCCGKGGEALLEIPYTLEGERQGEVFLFQVEPQYGADNTLIQDQPRGDLEHNELLSLLYHFNDMPSLYPHTLTFYDSAGHELPD